jgi:hypothetical protein
MTPIISNRVPMMALLVGVILTTIGISAMTPLQYAAAAGTEFSFNQNFPVSIAIFAPCLGEEVRVAGTLHDVFAIRTDNAGGFSLTSHFNLHNVKGVGQTTGEIYRGTEADQTVLHGKVGLEYTIAGHSNFISQGGGSNLLATQILHFRLNPNGTVTVSLDKFTVECKG